MYKPATIIKTTTMNGTKISASNPDLATITRIEMFIQDFRLLWSFRRPDRITGKLPGILCFLIVHIQLHQIDTPSVVFPLPSRLHANNWKKTDRNPALLGYFSDPEEQLMFSKPTWEIDIAVLSSDLWICNASRLPKTRNRCKQDVCSSPKIKLRMKLPSLLSCNLFYITTTKKRRTEDPFCFFMQRDVKNGIFARKFSLSMTRHWRVWNVWMG